MIDLDREFGDADVRCDSCPQKKRIEVEDEDLTFALVRYKIQQAGWTIKKENDHRKHYCPNCG